MSSRPWHPPDLTFTNTRSGFTPAGTMAGSMLGRSITGNDSRMSGFSIAFSFFLVSLVNYSLVVKPSVSLLTWCAIFLNVLMTQEVFGHNKHWDELG